MKIVPFPSGLDVLNAPVGYYTTAIGELERKITFVLRSFSGPAVYRIFQGFNNGEPQDLKEIAVSQIKGSFVEGADAVQLETPEGVFSVDYLNKITFNGHLLGVVDGEIFQMAG